MTMSCSKFSMQCVCVKIIITKFFNDYNEEIAQKEKDAEKDKEGGEGGDAGGEEDPLADI